MTRAPYPSLESSRGLEGDVVARSGVLAFHPAGAPCLGIALLRRPPPTRRIRPRSARRGREVVTHQVPRAPRRRGWGRIGVMLSTVALTFGSLGATPASASVDSFRWTQRSPATSPAARAKSSMAADPARVTVVLFCAVGNSRVFDNTW